jgi:glutamyl-tRNA synthetase
LKTKDLREYIEKILRADSKNFKQLDEFLTRNSYFFGPVIHSRYTTHAPNGQPLHDVPTAALVDATSQLHQIKPEDWSSGAIRDHLYKAVAAITRATLAPDQKTDKPESTSRLKAFEPKSFSTALYHYLRWAVAEGKQGPGVGDIMEILGRDESLARLNRAAAIASPK